MEKTMLEELLDANNYINVNKTMINVFGLHGAILISELMSERKYWRKENKLREFDDDTKFTGIKEYFYSSRENIEENTGLTPYYQRKAEEVLCSEHILSMVRKDVGANTYYALDDDKIYEKLKAFISRNESLSFQEIKGFNSNNNKYNTNKDNKVGTNVPTAGGTPASKTKIKHSRDFRNKTNTLNDILGEKDRLEEEQKEAQKPKKKTLYQKCCEAITDDTYNFSPSVQKVLKDYLAILLSNKDIKGINQWSYRLRALVVLSTDSETQVKIVEQSINHGLVGFSALDRVRKPFDKSQYSQQPKNYEPGNVVPTQMSHDEILDEIARREEEAKQEGRRTFY